MIKYKYEKNYNLIAPGKIILDLKKTCKVK